MKFIQHYSGSSANLYEVIANNGKRLLIECGCTWAKLQKALNYDLSNIAGCLLSHEHADHSKALIDVIRAGIDVYASEGTFVGTGIMQEVGKHEYIQHRRTKVIADKTLVRLDGFEVLAFGVNHDAKEPLGFVIREKTGIYEHRPNCLVDKPIDEYLLFATDTSHIVQRFNLPFSIIAIECSYDKDVLQERVDTQTINETLAKRLLTSHMERQNTIKYLAEFCNLSKCTEIHLLHLSGDNIDKRQARKDVEDKFFIKTVIK